MRYLRMYIVINVLMTGFVRAAEAAPTEEVPSVGAISTGEEPPQEVHEDSPEQNKDLESSFLSEQGDLTSQPSKNKGNEVKQPQTAQAAISDMPSEETITIEQAEALLEEHAHEQLAASNDGEKFPFQPPMTTNSLPEAPKSYDPVVPEQPEQEPTRGIDTMDLAQPRGNWLFKRYWWERAEEICKKMHAHVEKITDIQIKLFARRTELDKIVLDPFYTDIGLSQGDLQSIMQTLMSQLEHEREKHGALSDEEREMVTTIQKDRDRLQQLERDIRALGSLRDTADRGIDRVMDQKNRASQYEKESREAVREIARIVNDTQASELYYRIEASWRTIKDIYTYIDQDLNRYFDNVLASAREQSTRIKATLLALKEQGIDLKARVQQAQEQDSAKDLSALEDEKEKEKKAAVPKKTGWFSSGSRLFQAAVDVALWQFLQSIWDAIMWLPRRIYGTLTSLFR